MGMDTGLWVVGVGAGTESFGVEGDDLMKSSCKSPDVLPGIVSLYET